MKKICFRSTGENNGNTSEVGKELFIVFFFKKNHNIPLIFIEAQTFSLPLIYFLLLPWRAEAHPKRGKQLSPGTTKPKSPRQPSACLGHTPKVGWGVMEHSHKRESHHDACLGAGWDPGDLLMLCSFDWIQISSLHFPVSKGLLPPVF